MHSLLGHTSRPNLYETTHIEHLHNWSCTKLLPYISCGCGKLKLFCCNTQCRISVLVASCSSLSSHDCTPLLGCSGCSHYHETSLPSATQTSYNSWRAYLFFWPFLLNQISALTTNPLGNAKLFILFNKLLVFSLAWRHLASFLLLVGLLYPACCMVFPEFRCEYPTTFPMLVTLEKYIPICLE